MTANHNPPLLVIVTGPPCTGKTTLARRLAADLGLPLMSKDTIKETLFEVLGVPDRAGSKRLGGASMELLYTFIEAQLAAGQGCGAEREAQATTVLKRPEFTTTIDLNIGKGKAAILTCDYSIDYIKINADYRS